MPRTGKATDTESRLVVAQERGKWGMTPNGYRIAFCGDENVLELDNGNGCTAKKI